MAKIYQPKPQQQMIVTRSMTLPEKVKMVLDGNVPQRPPFVDRLELWFRHHRASGTLSKSFAGMELNDIERIAYIAQKIKAG